MYGIRVRHGRIWGKKIYITRMYTVITSFIIQRINIPNTKKCKTNAVNMTVYFHLHQDDPLQGMNYLRLVITPTSQHCFTDREQLTQYSKRLNDSCHQNPGTLEITHCTTL